MRAGLAFSAVLVGTIVTGAVCAQNLKVGEVYRGSVKLTDSMSGIYLPLPEGDWTLIGLGQTRNNSGVPFLHGRLMATQLGPQRKPRAFVSFSAALEASPTGWSKPSFCEQKNLHHIEPKDSRSSRGGGEIRCWGIIAQSMRPAENAAPYLHESYQWVGNNTAGMPLTTLRVTFYRASGPKFVQADYLFNPEVAHLPQLSTVNWDRDRIVSKPDQVKYVETLKRFGEAWSPKVERGFAGKPLSEADVALAAAADPMKMDTLPSGGYRACADERTLKGYSSGQKVLVTFDNRTGSDIVVHTLDGDGNRKVQGTVLNGHWRRLPTFVSQPWVVTDGGGKCLRVVMPGHATERVILKN